MVFMNKTADDGAGYHWKLSVGAAPPVGQRPGRAACARQPRDGWTALPGPGQGRRPRGARSRSTLRPRSVGGPASGAPTSAHVRPSPSPSLRPRDPPSRRSRSPRPALGSHSRRPGPARPATPLRSPTAAQREDGGVQIPPAAPRPPHPLPRRAQG